MQIHQSMKKHRHHLYYQKHFIPLSDPAIPRHLCFCGSWTPELGATEMKCYRSLQRLKITVMSAAETLAALENHSLPQSMEEAVMVWPCDTQQQSRQNCPAMLERDKNKSRLRENQFENKTSKSGCI